MGTDDPLPVTLLFTDIQGSTRLLRSVGDEAYRHLRATLSGLLRSVFRRHRGRVVDAQGDSFFVAFARSPLDAVAAALECQRTLASHAWPSGHKVRVRVGIHTGRLRRPTKPSGSDYVGLDVHRAARLCDAGHGGQVLVSEETQKLVVGRLPHAASLRRLGDYQLRDFSAPEPIYQVVVPDIASEFPPLRALDVRFFNLPASRTPLLGRETSVADIRHLLSQPSTGLVTLSGPGGIGKTRLAIAVASRASDDFSNGICFVALASIGEPELVVPTIIRRLSLQESGTAPPEEILSGYLRDRQLLLVLDNFEHLLPAAPRIADLLAACPKLRVLATSRAPLRIHGEREYAVSALGFPTLDRLPPHDEFDRYPAVALFAERATAATARFEITPRNFAAVTRLCARLDGLPLAIELAAARASLLTPREMLDRLQEGDRHASLDLLTGGARDAPVRHRTLRDAIGWSYGLLGPEAQALFRLLAVFVGGFTLEAASALATMMASAEPVEVPRGGRASAPSLALLDGVGKLVENNLLQRIERPGAEARFSMLETIREYGFEHLEATGELAEAQRCHATYFLALAEAGEMEAGKSRQAEWLARLDDEHANFRAALGWSLSGQGDSQIGAQLAGALWVFWYRRAYMREGDRWIQQIYSACTKASPRLRAKLLTADGSLVRMLGDNSRAEVLLETAVRLWRDLDDAEGLAWALSHLGLAKQWLGQLDKGGELLEESLALRLSSGDRRGIARSLFNLACGEDFRRNYDRAEGMCREALDLSSQVADKWGIGTAQAGLGGVAWARGELERAAELLKDSLLTFRDVGSRDRVAECLQDLASLFRRLGAVERSVRLSASADLAQHRSGLALWPAVQARRDEEVAAARASLGNAAFERAWSEGQLMDFEQAIDDVLTVPVGRGLVDPDGAKVNVSVP